MPWRAQWFALFAPWDAERFGRQKRWRRPASGGLAQVKTLKPTVQALCIALCAVLVCGLALSVRPAVRLATVKNVTLSDDAMTVQVKTHARTVAELLTEYDITLGEGDVVYPTLSDPVHKGDEILVRRAISVRVTADERRDRSRSSTAR